MNLRTNLTVEVTLTDREQAFLDNLSRGIKPTQAAIDAGYAGPQAARLLHKPHMAGLIRRGHVNLGRVVARMDRELAEAAAGEAE